jgi:hypothetical protein
VLALRRLRARVHLLTLGCVVPFVAHAIWTRTALPLTLDAEQARRTSDQATAVARHVERELARLDVLLETAAGQLQRSADLSLASNALADPGDPLTSRISIGVLDSVGAPVASLGGSAALINAVPVDRRRHIVSSVTSGEPERARTHVGSMIDVRSTRAADDSVAFILVRPITAGRARCDCLGDVSGALMIAITEAGARAMLGPHDGIPGTVVTVLDTAGATVAGTDARRWRSANDVWQDGRTSTRDSRSTDSASVGVDGIIRTVASAQITARPWRVVVGVPTLVAARVDTRVRDALLLAACGLLLASVGLTVTWRSFTTSMLRIIAELMPFASRGDGRPKPVLAADAPRASTGDMASRPARQTDTGETFAMMAALAEFARATADQPELQSAALARLQQLAGESPVSGTSVRDTPEPVVGPGITVTHLRIADDQPRFDTMPPTRV